MVSSGYSEITADRHATEVMQSPGVVEELSALGFTEENAKAVTAKIMMSDKARDNDRLKAVELTFKVHGSFKGEAPATQTNILNIFYDPNIQTATRTYESELKKLLANETPPTD